MSEPMFVRVRIDTDEVWPVFSLKALTETEVSSQEVSIPYEQYEMFQDAMKRYQLAQESIRPHYEEICERMREARNARREEEERQKELEVSIITYTDKDDIQECLKCGKTPQHKAVYQGSNYIGCEACIKKQDIFTTKNPNFPDIVLESLKEFPMVYGIGDLNRSDSPEKHS